MDILGDILASKGLKLIRLSTKKRFLSEILHFGRGPTGSASASFEFVRAGGTDPS